MRPTFALAPLAAALVLATGCATPRTAAPVDDEPRACTMDFRSVGFVLVDAYERPVDGARVEVRRTTGEIVTTDASLGQPSMGRYVIADDGTRVVPSGETMTVNASKDGRAVAGVYRLGHDGCHIEKLSGADTLRLR